MSAHRQPGHMDPSQPVHPFPLALAHYLVIAVYPDGEPGGSDPAPVFDDAVDTYEQHRREGRVATVLRLEPPRINAPLAVEDVTAEADRHLALRLWQRGDEMPEWLQ